MKRLITLTFVAFTLVTSAQNQFSSEWRRGVPYDRITTGFNNQFRGGAIADELGNLYYAATFTGSKDFDYGTSVISRTSSGSHDVFVLKVSPQGNILWVKTYGGLQEESVINLRLDDHGYLYLGGAFSGAVDFNPGPGFHFVTVASPSNYLLKLDTSGAFVDVVNFEGDFKNFAISPSGEIYLAADFTGQVDLDPGTGTHLVSSVGWPKDFFVTKLDSNLNFEWGYSFGAYNQDRVFEIEATDESVVLLGIYVDTVDFDPGPGVYHLNSGQVLLSFVLNLSSEGDFNWARSVPSSTSSEMALSPNGDVLIHGGFIGTVDMDPSPTNAVLISAQPGTNNYFLWSLDSLGNYNWVDTFVSDFVIDVQADDNGFYVGGNFSSAIVTDTSQSVAYSKGGVDSFVSYYDTLGNRLWTETYGGVMNDDLYFVVPSLGSAVYALGSVLDSVDLSLNSVSDYLVESSDVKAYVLKMLPCPGSYLSHDSIVACNSYTWVNGITYTESTDSVFFEYPSSQYCDSTVELNLTIIKPVEGGYDSIVACNYYVWQNGQSYTYSTNSPFVVLTGSNGCDSIHRLHLIINPFNPGIFRAGNYLYCNYPSGNFQWLDCDSGMVPIPGETGNIFFPSKNGSYALFMERDGCSDTTDCFDVEFIGLEESARDVVSVFPIPVEDVLTIDSGDDFFIESYKMISPNGQVILQGDNSDSEKILSIDMAAFPRGLYFLQVKGSNGQIYTQKIQKQ
ncbi:MAG: hypothetical protein SchgKO_18720 [Schleiferiaceae bacterium]